MDSDSVNTGIAEVTKYVTVLHVMADNLYDAIDHLFSTLTWTKGF